MPLTNMTRSQRNLRHLAELVESCKEGFVRFGVDCGTKWDLNIVVDAKEMREATARVMKRNQIPADRSEDLRKKRARAKNARGEMSK